MGREVRRVPEDWEHPKNERGNYIPLLDSFAERLKEWEIGNEKWDRGLKDDYNGGWAPFEKEQCDMSFEEWYGEKPKEKDYMPDFPQDQCTHYQMYETCSEGTPISPVMETPEELARWLADNGASAFGNMTATYEEWLCTIKQGGAVSCYINKDWTLTSGVSMCNKGRK